MPWNNTENTVQNYAHVQGLLTLEDRLPQTIIKGVLKTRCECGRHVQALRIVDTRSLPFEITKGQKWACDGCWTAWIRHDPQYQRAYQGHPFRILNWLELQDAPPATVTRQIARDSVKHAKMAAKIVQIENTPDDDGQTRELARMNDNLDRMVDRARSPVPKQE